MNANVRFESLCDKDYRPTSGDFVTRLALRMNISDLAETLPLNICLLVDRSMSMTGAKMDAARESAGMLIDVLRDEDRLSLIAFSAGADLLLENITTDEVGKTKARDSLNGIRPGGVTRMDLALEKGYQLLAQAGTGYLNMLLMLSDGAPTNHLGYVLSDAKMEALCATIDQALHSSATVTSTIGLGDAADCLAPFLESCAEKGQGVFYHENDPSQLVDRFLEEFHRIKGAAITNARFHVNGLAGRLRKAAVIYPNLRELPIRPESDGSFLLDVGALQKGEEHAFLLEVVTSGDGEQGKKKLCDVSVSYHMEGEEHFTRAESQVLEFTDDEQLLHKPGHEQVEKYKAMYLAFQQTRFAADNVRAGGDAKKTKALLASAAKTTRRLGMTQQTKLLSQMAEELDGEGTLSENQLTAISAASRKTKVLQAS